MKKKILSLIMVFTMTSAIMVGCGSENAASPEPADVEVTPQQQETTVEVATVETTVEEKEAAQEASSEASSEEISKEEASAESASSENSAAEASSEAAEDNGWVEVTSDHVAEFRGETIDAELQNDILTGKVTIIPDKAFAGDKPKIGRSSLYSFTYVSLPDTVTIIGEGAFQSEDKLTEVYLPESIVKIGSNAFSSCSALSIINIPSGITSIEDNTFWGDRSLEKLELPEGLKTIGAGAFDSCKVTNY